MKNKKKWKTPTYLYTQSWKIYIQRNLPFRVEKKVYIKCHKITHVFSHAYNISSQFSLNH